MIIQFVRRRLRGLQENWKKAYKDEENFSGDKRVEIYG